MTPTPTNVSEGLIDEVLSAIIISYRNSGLAYIDPATKRDVRKILERATLSPSLEVERLRSMSGKLDLLQCEDVLLAADAMEKQVAALRWIDRHYADQDMSHADFRVEAYRQALSALPPLEDRL